MKPAKPYSAVIVLGNLMDPEGKLNSESQSRVDRGVRELKTQSIGHLLTCGWAYRPDSDLPIAKAMKNYVLKTYDVDDQHILTECTSRDTVGDAIFSKMNFALHLGWERLLVVTSDYHVDRTQEKFRYIYGDNYTVDVVGAPSGKGSEQQEHEKNSLEKFYTTIAGAEKGDHQMIYQKIIENHPFYNGEIFPKLEGLSLE